MWDLWKGNSWEVQIILWLDNWRAIQESEKRIKNQRKRHEFSIYYISNLDNEEQVY